MVRAQRALGLKVGVALGAAVDVEVGRAVAMHITHTYILLLQNYYCTKLSPHIILCSKSNNALL